MGLQRLRVAVGDAVVEVVGGAVEPEAAEVSRQRRRGVCWLRAS